MGISIPHPLPVMKRSLFGVLTTLETDIATEMSYFKNSNTKSNLDIFAICPKIELSDNCQTNTIPQITNLILICHFSSDNIHNK